MNEFEEFFSGEAKKYCDKLSESEFEELELKKGDVLVCRTNGNPKLVGKAALVIDGKKQAFASYLFRVRVDDSKINPEALVVFLNSKFGRSEIEKFLMPSIQSNFSPAQFREIKIPIFEQEIQQQLKEDLQQSFSLLKESKTLYSQAENLLLEELGLKDFEKDTSLSWVVNLSEVETAGRMDAEYFQPKYAKLLERLEVHQSRFLPEVIQNVPAKFDPSLQRDDSFKYVELSNINGSIGVIDGCSEVLGREAPSRAKRILKAGDVIVSSVEGSLGKVALVDKTQEGHLASTGFFQFRSKKLLPEVLLVLAKSFVLQMQLEKYCAGTILTAVPKEAINQITIPTIPKPTQQKIAELVRVSHEARKKSKALLEETKRMVEELIESHSA